MAVSFQIRRLRGLAAKLNVEPGKPVAEPLTRARGDVKRRILGLADPGLETRSSATVTVW
jgi:hypothetical protein